MQEINRTDSVLSSVAAFVLEKLYIQFLFGQSSLGIVTEHRKLCCFYSLASKSYQKK